MKKLDFLRWIGVSTAGCLMGVGAYADGAPVRAVDSVAMTVGNLDVSRAFYESVLKFQFLSETEVSGEAYEHLYGVFGLRAAHRHAQAGRRKTAIGAVHCTARSPVPRGFSQQRSLVSARGHHRVGYGSCVCVAARAQRDLSPRAAPKCFLNRTNRLPAFQPSIFGIPTGTTWKCCISRDDKGNPKWHEHTGRLFLGIDHTAIVVADTESSLKFYRDTLGLAIVGASENYGTEQEHLNNVFGARLRITALRAARGPGVELLEYLTPRDGRALPLDTRANDIWHWQINLTADVDAVERADRAPITTSDGFSRRRHRGRPENRHHDRGSGRSCEPAGIDSAPVIKRMPPPKVRYAQNQFTMVATRLRSPTRNPT